jgi:4-amino-4-deoxy-L-arabinose transferase-like glycosyltransferase
MKLLLCCVLFVLLHWLRPTEQRAQKIQYRVGLLCALGFGLSTLWINSWYSPNPFFESDFAEYCVGVVEMERGWFENDIPPKRTRLAALLPTIGSKVTSMMNGFALSSILSTLSIFVLVYMWGSALGGVGAGIFSVGILSMMAPMVLLPRFLTYYPPIVLTTVFAATGLALWGRFRTPVTALICGLGIAGCLLIDVRGVVWAVPFWIGGICLLSFNVKASNVLSALLLHLPIWGSWFGAWWIYSPNASSLEKQLDVRPLYVGFDEDNPLFQPPWNIDSNFVWGWFDPSQIGATINFVIDQRSYPVPQGFLDWQLTEQGPKEEIAFWTVMVGLGLLFGVMTMWRRQFGKSKIERILLFLCTLSPFVLLFHSLQSMVEQHIRFYMHTAPGIAVAFGVGMALSLPQLKLLKYWHRTPQMVRIGTWFVCAIGLIMMVHFSETSPLYARADWRYEWRLNALDWSRINQAKSSSISLKAYEQTCADRLQDESMMPSVYP